MTTLVLFTMTVSIASGLENGLARTPPMGWLAWGRFRCNTDCENDPKHCISENLFKEMTDVLVKEGYVAAGYNLISLDDCWMDTARDQNGRLQGDSKRFPSGIKALSDYVHSKGLKFGIYENYGTHTCALYPGIIDHMEVDAKLFAEWNVDYVKVDGCNAKHTTMDKGYPEFGKYLNLTGRPMVYSCSWPYYQLYYHMEPNYTLVSHHCNLWRNYKDIDDSWDSVRDIIDYYGNNQDVLIPNAGPGHWNDPDMLLVGNYGLSYEQSKVQMAIWAILAAPLLMSVDLRTIRPEYKEILLNRKVIAVNQDPLGIQGKRIFKAENIEIWSRPILPVKGDHFSYAFVFLSRRVDGTPSEVSVSLAELGLEYPNGYFIEDLFNNQEYGVVSLTKIIKVEVNPTGAVMIRCKVAES